MSLKAYSFTRTSQHGAEQNCYITVESIAFDWERATMFASFKNYESQAEASRGTMPRASFNLKLAGNDFLAQAMQPVTAADKNLPFLLVFSNRIWEIAMQTKFIPDFSGFDESGKRVETLKTLAEFDPTLHEIAFS